MEMRWSLISRRNRENAVWGLCLAGLVVAGLAQPAAAVDCNGLTIERVSVGPGQVQAVGGTGSVIPFLSADGCTVAFKSDATNLVSSGNDQVNVFVRDRINNVTVRISNGLNGMPADGGSFPPVLSGDGLLVAFGSFADNLVPSDFNAVPDVFVVDRTTGTTARVDLGVGGMEANNQGGTPDIPPSISSDGRFVAFTSSQTNLVPFPQDLNGGPQVFVFDQQSQTTELISRDLIHSSSPGGAVDTGASAPALNGCSTGGATTCGRFVVFLSTSAEFVLNDTNQNQDVFVWDRQQQTIDRVSVDSNGNQSRGGDNQPSGYPPAISDDGSIVAFASNATNLVPGDDNGVTDVFVRDRVAGTTTRVGLITGCSTDGASGSGTVEPTGASDSPSLSADGRFLAFKSLAPNLVSGEVNVNHAYIFVLDRSSGLIARILGGDGTVEPNGDSSFPNISADGNWIAFQSDATNLVAGDTNGETDIFVAANPFLTGSPIPGVTPLPACTATPTANPTSCAPGGCPAGLICAADLCVTPTPSPSPTSCATSGCPSGLVCAMDQCVTPTPSPPPTSCATTGCPSGLVCTMNQCVTPTPSPTPTSCITTGCPSGLVCVMDQCVTPTPSPTPSSCATTGCPGGLVCVLDQCVTPTPSLTRTPTPTITQTPTKKSSGGGGGGCSCNVDPRAPRRDGQAGAAMALPILLWVARRRAATGRQGAASRSI